VWRLIFVDEFEINRAMSRIYAGAPRGEHARVKEPSDSNNPSLLERRSLQVYVDFI
jgi:hypothetical protein